MSTIIAVLQIATLTLTAGFVVWCIVSSVRSNRDHRARMRKLDEAHERYLREQERLAIQAELDEGWPQH